MKKEVLKDIKNTGRENKERYNISLKALYNLGINPYGITGFQAVYLEQIAPQYIEEMFKDSLGVQWNFKVNLAHSAKVNPSRYKLISYEEAFKISKTLDAQSPVTKTDIAFKRDLRLLELAGLVLQDFKDTGWTTEPAHFVIGEKEEAVEFFIGVKDSDLSKNYNEKNIFRDL